MCVIGSVISAVRRYRALEMEAIYAQKYEQAMSIANTCQDTDRIQFGRWLDMANRHSEKMAEFKRHAQMANGYLALNIGAIVGLVIYLILTGKI